MKAAFFYLFVSALLPVLCLAGQGLTRDQALKIGADNDGAANGKFWFQEGDAAEPFAHAGHIVISHGSQISLTVRGGTAGLGVDAPFDDGSQTRLDFFTSSTGRGWVTAHTLKPEVNGKQLEPPRDERPQAHAALSAAAEWAIQQKDLSLLKSLFKRGLLINEVLDFEKKNTLLHEAVASADVATVKFLLDKGADRNARNSYGERPVTLAIESKNKALCDLLARKEGSEATIEGFPAGLIDELLPSRNPNELFFFSWNGSDPSEKLLAEIRKTLPKARPASKMRTLDRRPLGAASWYQDKDTDEFGTLIQVTLNNAEGTWTASIRQTVGPIMAGGGRKGTMRRDYGFWHMVDAQGWDE